MESVTLLDAVYSARLSMQNLPALANVQQEQTGVAPASDPYAAPAQTLATLSGYGQLLSSASRAADGLGSLLGSSSNTTTTTNSAVATGTASASAMVASYDVTVTQQAKANALKSGMFASATDQIFSAGTFTLSVGNNEPVSISLRSSGGLIEAVGYQWGSLNGLANAINTSSAGVTASVESGEYGFSLKLESNTTGKDNTIKLANTTDPFNSFAANLQQLGFSQTQAGQDAEYTVNNGTGAVAGTSASNTGISLGSGTGASFTITGTGSATINVTATPVVSADSTAITTAANTLIQNYNTLQGTAAQLTATGGALNGDTTTATPLSSALSSATQASYSGKTLADIGITASSSGALSITDTTLFSNAITADAAGTASLLTSVANNLHSTISGYLGDTGTIVSNAKSTAQNMAFINGQTAASTTGLSNDIKEYLLQKSLANTNVPLGLPSFSIFA